MRRKYKLTNLVDVCRVDNPEAQARLTSIALAADLGVGSEIYPVRADRPRGPWLLVADDGKGIRFERP
jgi:hypothetical protein